MIRTRMRTAAAVALLAAATLASTGHPGPAAATAGPAPASACSTAVGCGGPRSASPVVRSARPTAHPSAAFGVLNSVNWAGYAGQAGDFTAVRASWRVPAVNCAKVPTASYVAEWAGIDGLRNSKLIQAGVDARCDSSTAQPQYRLFYELIPQAETPVSGAVGAGDAVAVEIGQSAGAGWRLRVTVNGVARLDTVLAYPADRTSAECIVEAPSAPGGGVLPLADYGTVTFTGCAAARAGAATGRQLGAGSSGDLTVYRVDDDANGVRQVTGTPSADGSRWTTGWVGA
jgi:hypothetical protein